MPRLFFFLTLIILSTIAPVVGVLMVILDVGLLPAIIATPVLMSLIIAEILQNF